MTNDLLTSEKPAVADSLSASGLIVTGLFCEGVARPLGIDAALPFLSWHLAAVRRGAKVTACQVQVAGTEEALLAGQADLWDSSKVNTPELNGLAYRGLALASTRGAWWRVRVWDENNTASAWSETGYWEMGLLDEKAWQGATWIQHVPEERSSVSPYFRQEFTSKPSLQRARAYFCGLGFGELWLNGAKVSDGVLDPAQTDYEIYSFYRVFDVTSQLVAGKNCVGAILGDGWYHQDKVWGYEPYGHPGLRMALLLEYSDGETEWVISDANWKSNQKGPIRSSNIYAGEIYDATLEYGGWSEPGFLDMEWKSVAVPAKPLSPVLHAQVMPPERPTEFLKPVGVQRTRPGTWVFDFGQNFAGWARLKVRGERGTEYCLRFAENVDSRGDIDPLSTGTLYTKYVATDRYFCHGRGDEPEVWEPRFSCHGFRYVELTGCTETPPDDILLGVAVHTDTPKLGTFACSDPLINNLQKIALWTLRSNLHGLPTDCPAREKCGWLGDSHHISSAASYNLDLGTLWRKYFTDILNSIGQAKVKTDFTPSDPRMPSNIAPGLRRCEQANPDWAAAIVLVPWHLFVFEGDRETFSRGYDTMKGVMDYLEENAPEGIIKEGFGDWCPPGKKDFPSDCPVPLTSTAFYYRMAYCMERFAKELGQSEDEERFRLLAKRIQYQFNSRFLDPVEVSYGSQTGNVIALAFDLPPSDLRQNVADALALDLGQKRDGHFTMGIHGMHYAFGVLSAYGHNDVCQKVLAATGFPSFSHLISQGATTFWEMFFDLNLHPDFVERSRNHPMHAAFSTWFYDGIGGISPDPEKPGFANIIVKPQMTEYLEWADVSYTSVRGLIRSNWRTTGDRFHWEVEIPGGASGELYLPKNMDLRQLTESGERVVTNDLFETSLAPDNSLIVKVEAGSYVFEAPVIK